MRLPGYRETALPSPNDLLSVECRNRQRARRGALEACDQDRSNDETSATPYRRGRGTHERAVERMSAPWTMRRSDCLEGEGKAVPDLLAPELRVLFVGINPS